MNKIDINGKTFERKHIYLLYIYCLDFLLLLFGLYNILSITGMITIVYGYYLLIKYKSIASVIPMICHSYIISGYIFPGPFNYDIFNTLQKYISIILYIILNINSINMKELTKYKYTRIYIILIGIHFIFSFNDAIPLLGKSYLPLILFLIISLGIINKDKVINSKFILKYFRIVSVISFVTYFFPNYPDIISNLFSSGNLFGGTSVDDYNMSFMGIVRNHGIYMDHRIMGIFSYLYLYVAVRAKDNNKFLDIILSLICIISTASRGSFVVYFAILLAYLLKEKQIKILSFSILSLFFVVFFGLLSLESNDKQFLESFNLSNKENALSQRSIFADYSINSFKENPLFGNGYGYLTANNGNKRFIYASKDVIYETVSDAYLFSTLGEIGLVGFILFILSTKEIFLKKKDIISIAFLIAYLIQLTGTDIPNMYMNYCFLLIITNHLQLYSKSKNEIYETAS